MDLLFEVMKAVPRLVEGAGAKSDERTSHCCYCRRRRRLGQLTRFACCITGRRHAPLPILTSLGRQSSNACREVRQAALSQLSRALLGPLVSPEDADADELFERVLFPLLEELLAAPRGADATETRLRGATLLCKAFMRFEVREGAEGVEAETLWVRVLDMLARLVASDRSDQMVSGVLSCCARALG